MPALMQVRRETELGRGLKLMLLQSSPHVQTRRLWALEFIEDRRSKEKMQRRPGKRTKLG